VISKFDQTTVKTGKMAKSDRPSAPRIDAHRQRMLASGYTLIDATLRLEANTVLERIQLRTGLSRREVVDRLLRHPEAPAMIEASHV
jgi:glycerate-2-kinase